MTKQDILFALDITHPGGAPIMPGAAWETLEDLIQVWEGSGDAPTLAELETALTAHQAVEAAIVTRAATRTALREQWDALPPWIRGPFQDKFAAANVLLDAKQDEAAASLIEYASPPAAYTAEQLTTFAAVQAQFLAAINSLSAEN